MESTRTAETAAVAEEQGFREVLSELAGKDLDQAAFARVARAAFRDASRRAELEKLLQDWDSVASSAGLSGSTAKIVAGSLEYLRGRLDEARKILTRHKATAWGAYWLGRVHVARGDLRAAQELLDAACEKQDLPLLHYLRAEVLCRRGEEEEALRVVEELRDRDRGSADWSLAHGYYLQSVGEYRPAIHAYRTATRRDPQNAEAWFRLGYLLDLHGSPAEERRDEAVLAYETCTRIAPLHTNAVINLGLIYEDRERYHDAAKCYETVLRHYPNHPRANLYHGDAVASTRMFYDRDMEKKADRHSQILKIPVTDFELSVRSRNCLQKMNIETLGDLIMKTEQELLSYKNFGETSLKEIKEMLTQKGLRLGQGLEDRASESGSGRNPLEATVASEVLDKPIDELNLSSRSRRCMDRLEVHTLRDLINKTEVELMSAKNFGMTSLNEIKRKLGELGLDLRS